MTSLRLSRRAYRRKARARRGGCHLTPWTAVAAATRVVGRLRTRANTPGGTLVWRKRGRVSGRRFLLCRKAAAKSVQSSVGGRRGGNARGQVKQLRTCGTLIDAAGMRRPPRSARMARPESASLISVHFSFLPFSSLLTIHTYTTILAKPGPWCPPGVPKAPPGGASAQKRSRRGGGNLVSLCPSAPVTRHSAVRKASHFVVFMDKSASSAARVTYCSRRSRSDGSQRAPWFGCGCVSELIPSC